LGRPVTLASVIPDDSASADDEITVAQMIEGFHRALARLPWSQRQVIRLYHLPPAGEEPRTLEQIGDKLGFNVDSARQLLRKAEANLSKLAEAEGLREALQALGSD
jgi:DNA-directed RNA polymerase sigma subunit (sigma70/sigma32)